MAESTSFSRLGICVIFSFNAELMQKEVADKTGINMVTLSGYEIGKNEPNLEALVRLADVYKVSLDYLMCRTDEKE